MAGHNIIENNIDTGLLEDTITAKSILSPFGNPSAWDTITIGGLTWGSPIGPAGPSAGATIVGLDGIVTSPAPASLQSLAQPPVAPSPTPNGYVVIEGAERVFSWDPKHGKAQEGWLPTYQGTKGKQFKLKFRMWTDAQFQYWLQYRKMFDYLLLKLSAGFTVVAPTASTAPTVTATTTTITSATGTRTQTTYAKSSGSVNALSVSHPKLKMIGITAIYCEVIHELKPVGTLGEFEVQVDVWEFRPPPPRNTSGTINGTNKSPPTTPLTFQTPTQKEEALVEAKIVAAQAAIAARAVSAAAPGAFGPNQ